MICKRTQLPILITVLTRLNSNKKNDVESQKLTIKETSPQVSGFNAESLLPNQTRSTPVQCLNDSKKQQPETQRK